MAKKPLTVEALLAEAEVFAKAERIKNHPELFGVTDGKAVGTWLEKKFSAHVLDLYETSLGNAAHGIDFPEIEVDIKVTSIRQPQSSCPFRNARQKIFGLGYSLLVFVYDKQDNKALRASRMDIQHVVFVDKKAASDYTMTRRLAEMARDGANEEDITGYLQDRYLPVDETEARDIARLVLEHPPRQGYLTISNALQWRLQYSRALQEAGKVSGVLRLL
jgi:hypothetical protein